MMSHSTIARASLLVFSLLLGFGCDSEPARGPGGGGGGLVAPPTPPEKADPLDEAIAAQEGYVYNPIGKRDPFRSFLSFGSRAEDTAPRTPLQKYEIDQYQLVGIVWGMSRPRALVEDPEGVGHVMEMGTYVGRNWGKVTQISDNEVVVTEEYKTIDGELVVNPIKMQLVTDDL
ncbi:MAG: type IV pilus assembly protein PilP [Myxococcota bacterium]|jgi:type IV pilus assembly protein PilP